MTVNEMIEHLSQLPPDAEVIVSVYLASLDDTVAGSPEEIDIHDGVVCIEAMADEDEDEDKAEK